MIAGRRIGREAQPVVVVDDFHPDPKGLREFAAQSMFGEARNHYPGIRAELPGDFFISVRATLVPLLREAFGATTVRLIDASFSIVTTPPDRLTVQQRLPHVDAVQPGRVALVHYLSDDSDGTAFFRHRATGFETIDAARSATYFATLAQELREGGAPPAAYRHDSDAQFERIDHVAARFNRAVVYPSTLLHSGAIRPGARLDADPATGRLTVTAFLSV